MNLNNKIDIALRKEKAKMYGIMILVVLSLSVLYIPFLPISNENIEGLTVKLTANLTDEGNIPVWLVKINDENVIRASLPIKLIFKKGKKIEIRKTKLLIGKYSYTVIRYL